MWTALSRMKTVADRPLLACLLGIVVFGLLIAAIPSVVPDGVFRLVFWGIVSIGLVTSVFTGVVILVARVVGVQSRADRVVRFGRGQVSTPVPGVDDGAPVAQVSGDLVDLREPSSGPVAVPAAAVPAGAPVTSGAGVAPAPRVAPPGQGNPTDAQPQRVGTGRVRLTP